MRPLLARTGTALALAGALAGTFVAGYAYAADARLDQANDQVTRAIALLEAAEDPMHPARPFGGHRGRAVKLLKDAQVQIAKAKAAADKPVKQPKPAPAPTPAPSP